jgi:CheY-like chemotaxis protein
MSDIPLLNGKRVVIIDDSATTRLHLRKIIESLGATATESEDPIEGLAMINAESPDLVTLDMQMPYMDGKTMLHYLRIKRRNPVPVIVCTSLNDTTLLVDLAKLKISDFLLKPFDTSMARKKIADALIRTV